MAPQDRDIGLIASNNQLNVKRFFDASKVADETVHYRGKPLLDQRFRGVVELPRYRDMSIGHKQTLVTSDKRSTAKELLDNGSLSLEGNVG